MTAISTMGKDFVLSKHGFAGLDERAGCSTGIEGMPRILNFKVNESGHLEKRGGYKLFGTVNVNRSVTKLWSGNTDQGYRTVAACNYVMYNYDANSQAFNAFGEVIKDVSEIFNFRGKLYVLGGDMYEIDGEVLSTVKGYVPLVATACSPSGEGTALELPNLLSNSRRVRYSGDGVSPDYTLPESNIAAVESVTVNGEPWAGQYNAHLIAGRIEFAAPLPQGVNNIEIQYSVPDNEMSARIRRCRHAVIFEDRLFLYDNKDCPEYMFHSELADGIPSAAYFTEVGYHVFDESIKALAPCYNRLLIFFENSSKFTYSELRTDIFGYTYTSYPIYQLNNTKGHIITANVASFDNTPVTLSHDGFNKWVSTMISDERSAVMFSERAFKTVRKMTETKEDILVLNRRSASEIWICHTGGTLVYNYAMDCFYYYDIDTVSSLTEYESGLLLGMKDGRVYYFSEEYRTDNGRAITAELETPYCTFGAPYTLKSLSRLCLVTEGGGALEVSITAAKGNGSPEQDMEKRLKLPDVGENGHRRIMERLCFKRFYSCKLKLGFVSGDITVTEMHLYGRAHVGGIRVN